MLVCEAAPKGFRGGNSRHTRNIRTAHDGPDEVLEGTYTEDGYADDLMRVTAGKTTERLARLTIRESAHIKGWMQARVARFQKSPGGTLSLSRTNPVFPGGGTALLNTLYRRVEVSPGRGAGYPGGIRHRGGGDRDPPPPLPRRPPGLDTGFASVGLKGSPRRLEYACVGDTVNVAARLQDLTKTYGTWNVVSEPALAALAAFSAPGLKGAPLAATLAAARSVPQTQGIMT